MTREERRAAAIERGAAAAEAWLDDVSDASAESLVAAVLDASGLLDDGQCQFSDSPGLQHTPFSERAPICWSCFNALLDDEYEQVGIVYSEPAISGDRLRFTSHVREPQNEHEMKVYRKVSHLPRTRGERMTIPDAAVEAGAHALRLVAAEWREAEARAVLDAATVEIECRHGDPSLDLSLVKKPCPRCNGTGTLRVLRTGETR